MTSRYSDKNKILCAKLADLRQKKGMTQRDLAEKIGRVQNYISNYEHGQRRLDVFEFFEICRALEVDCVEILKNAYTSWE
jgi:transcriptional regulator with XRE-family HTH domain